MNKFKLTAILGAGAALAFSPAHVAAQPAAKPISMGAQLKPHAEGAEISAMLPDRTAAAIGFKTGDVIIEANGKAATPEALYEYTKPLKAGDQLSFKVKRAGAIIELSGKGLAAPDAPAPAPQQK